VLRELPVRSAIIDGELVASNAAGMPDFRPLFLHQRSLPSSARGRSISWPSTVRICGDGHWKQAREGCKPS